MRDLTYPKVLIQSFICLVPILRDGKTEVSPHKRAPFLSPSCLDRMTLVLTQYNEVEKIVSCDKLIDKSNWNRSKGPRNLRGVKLPCKGGCWRGRERRGRTG